MADDGRKDTCWILSLLPGVLGESSGEGDRGAERNAPASLLRYVRFQIDLPGGTPEETLSIRACMRREREAKT